MNKQRQAILGEKGWHVDHVIPVVRNPVTKEMEQPQHDTFENKVPACASCNINKHSMPLESWRRIIEGYVTSLNRDSTQYKVAKRYGLIEEQPVKVEFWFERNDISEHASNQSERYTSKATSETAN